MRKPLYEVIENAVIFACGSIGIITGLLMIGFVGGYNWIPAIVCGIVSAIFMFAGVSVWNVQEGRKCRR